MFEFQLKQIDNINEFQKEIDKFNSKLMYLLYASSSGNINYLGETLPRYEDLPDNIKANWLHIANVCNEMYFTVLIDYPHKTDLSHILYKMSNIRDSVEDKIIELETELYGNSNS